MIAESILVRSVVRGIYVVKRISPSPYLLTSELSCDSNSVTGMQAGPILLFQDRSVLDSKLPRAKSVVYLNPIRSAKEVVHQVNSMQEPKEVSSGKPLAKSEF